MPKDVPVSRPVIISTVTEVLPVLHVPPVDTSLTVVICPTHSVGGPMMRNGSGFTVTVAVATQLPKA